MLKIIERINDWKTKVEFEGQIFTIKHLYTEKIEKRKIYHNRYVVAGSHLFDLKEKRNIIEYILEENIQSYCDSLIVEKNKWLYHVVNGEAIKKVRRHWHFPRVNNQGIIALGEGYFYDILNDIKFEYAYYNIVCATTKYILFNKNRTNEIIIRDRRKKEEVCFKGYWYDFHREFLKYRNLQKFYQFALKGREEVK